MRSSGAFSAIWRSLPRYRQLLDAGHGLAVPFDARVLDLDDSLARLETLDSCAEQVVELRFFGGLTDEEVGVTLGISVATVKRDWDFARSWLLSQME